MKISIVTPSYNQADFIKSTLDSILSQEFDGELEIIVMDGGSTDGTVEILKTYDNRVKWTSAKDDGQSDAINQGVEKATGDIVGWLNSDDLYLPGTLQTIVDAMNQQADKDWFFGKCKIIDGSGEEIWKGVTRYKNIRLKNHSYNNLLTENYISQPAVFFKKELFVKSGSLDKSLNFAMDYDLWLRFGKFGNGAFIDKYLSLFRRHGDSKSETDFTSQFREQYNVSLRYGPGKTIRLRHKFNIIKIILAYRLINMVR